MAQPLRIQPGQEAPTPGAVPAITPDTRFRTSLRVLVAMGASLVVLSAAGSGWVFSVNYRMDAVEKAVKDAADAERQHHEETQRELRRLGDRMDARSPWSALPPVRAGAQP